MALKKYTAEIWVETDYKKEKDIRQNIKEAYSACWGTDGVFEIKNITKIRRLK